MVVDCFFVEYMNEVWEICLGCQCVNWGISIVWNFNDIFNVYFFIDFDYEECFGVDVLWVWCYLGYIGSVELVICVGDMFWQSVFVGCYVFNKGSYDIQFIGGYV